MENFADLEEVAKKWSKKQQASQDNSKIESSSDTTENYSEDHKSSCSQFEQYQETLEQRQPQQQAATQSSTQFRKQTKRNHMPQIIDEDTEHYKIKIEHLLNIFKNDAIKEFLDMKKYMLEEQQLQIKTDTQRYLQMFEDKSQELSTTKDQLAIRVKECETFEQKLETLSKICCIAKQRWYLQKNLNFYFNQLKFYRLHRVQQKREKEIADKFYKKNLIQKKYLIWASKFRALVEEKKMKDVQQQHSEYIEEITGKYNKEIQALQQRLQEQLSMVQQLQEEKVNIQESLKKAFMRGVCALNFEAMNVLQGKNQDQQQQQQQTINKEFKPLQGSISNQQGNERVLSEMTVYQSTAQFQQQQPSVVQKQFDDNNDTDSNDQYSQMDRSNLLTYEKKSNSPQKTIIFVNPSKAESKDHKWKDAPVVGIDSQQQLENKENLQTVSGLKPVMLYSDEIDENEGRVIKVNQKSSLKHTDKQDKKPEKKVEFNTKSHAQHTTHGPTTLSSLVTNKKSNK